MFEFDRLQSRRIRNPQRLTIREAATLLNFHPNSIHYWIKQGQLRARFDGYKYTIKPSELDRFLKKYYRSEGEDE